jgi:iron complex outermembrane receptor protein
VTAPILAHSSEFDAFGGSTISGKQNETFGKTSLDKSVDLAPGVISSNMGNQRNEQNIYIHGFDRWQAPLSIDGIRVYLPADNRLDFARFLTPDVSEVQIAKGYVSVLDGPGGMGGAINLVSRKPTKPIEAEVRTSFEFGRDGAYEGPLTYGLIGTKQDQYYLQASGTWRYLRGWELPGSYTSTVNENGGLRDHSSTRDWNINLKAGWTPNASDEYSLNFNKQEGSKGAPYNVDPNATNRYWTWPTWNVQTLSAATKTAIGNESYVATKLYWEKFDNSINMYDDAAQTQMYSTSAEYSYYADWAAGGSIEAGHDFGKSDTLKGAFFYRRDNHSEWNQYFVDQYGLNGATTLTSSTCPTTKTTNVPCFFEPKQHDVEDTYSAALENTYHVTKQIDLVQGISYDWRHLLEANDYSLGSYTNKTYYPSSWVYYPLADSHAVNWQGAAIWRYSDTAKLYANISDRTRFPTIFERFSSRFGSAASNPSLNPERAVNYQIGWTNAFAEKSQVSVDVYYATVKDLIQSVTTSATYTDPITKKVSNISQSQNVGDGYRYGIDIAADYALLDNLTIGGNFSYIHNVITNPSDANYKQSGIPELKSLLYASWKPISTVTLTPSFEVASQRWTSSTINGATTYFETGAYALVNLSAEWRVQQNVTLNAGVRNIFDRAYTPAWGYPDPGRSFFAGLKATF